MAKVLRIINSFEPVPLIRLLGKQGFISYTEKIQADLFHTYFFREQVYENKFVSSADTSADNWEKTMLRFESRLETIDVRSLPMPQPMHRILEMLDDLSQEKALLVYHKRIPVFLLPELEERKLRYLTCKIDEDNVNMLIFKS